MMMMVATGRTSPPPPRCCRSPSSTSSSPPSPSVPWVSRGRRESKEEKRFPVTCLYHLNHLIIYQHLYPLTCTNKIRYLTWFGRLISLKAIAKQVQMNVFYQSLAGSRRQSRRPRPSCPWWGTAASPATTRTPAQSATGSRWAANIFTGGRDIFTRANIHRGSIMSTACVWLSTTLTSPSTAPNLRKM